MIITCKTCGKELPTTEYFYKNKTCIDCLMRSNGGVFPCSRCKKNKTIADYTRRRETGGNVYISRICKGCKPHKSEGITKSAERRKKNGRLQFCKKCGKPPTERDRGNLSFGLCSDCLLEKYDNDTPTIETIMDQRSMHGSHGIHWQDEE